MKKFNSFLLIAGLVLLGSLSTSVHQAKASPLQNITITSAQIINSNTVSVNLGNVTDNGDGGGIGNVDATKWHIDVNGGGVSPLNPISALIHNSSATAAVLYLTFSGTPFSNTSKSYSAANGLYVDANGTEDGVSDTNVVVLDSASIAIEDRQAPTFVSAVATSDTNIQVTFSEPVTVVNSNGSGFDLTANGVVITAATINADPTKVDLTTDPLGHDGNFWSGGGLDISAVVVQDVSTGHNSNAQTLNQDVSDGQSPETPIASPVSGSYFGTQGVSLSSTGSQSIRYSIDGSTPDCSTSSLYSSSISVSAIGSTTIKAIGCDDQGNSSAVATFAYNISTPPSVTTSGSSRNFTPLQPVNIMTNTTTPPTDCVAGYSFSPSTGAPCNAGTVVICVSGSLFSATTGEKCTTFSSNGTSINTGTYAFGTTLVKQGSKGDSCKAWQIYFNAHGASLTVDGMCGSKTIDFAKKWQASVGIKADGELGSVSRSKAI